MNFLLIAGETLSMGFHKYFDEKYFIVVDPYHLLLQLRYCGVNVLDKSKVVHVVSLHQKLDIMCIAHDCIYTKSVNVIDSCSLIDYIIEHYKSFIDITLETLPEMRYDTCKAILLYAIKYELWDIIEYLVSHELFFSEMSLYESYDYELHLVKVSGNEKIYKLIYDSLEKN